MPHLNRRQQSGQKPEHPSTPASESLVKLTVSGTYSDEKLQSAQPWRKIGHCRFQRNFEVFVAADPVFDLVVENTSARPLLLLKTGIRILQRKEGTGGCFGSYAQPIKVQAEYSIHCHEDGKRFNLNNNESWEPGFQDPVWMNKGVSPFKFTLCLENFCDTNNASSSEIRFCLQTSSGTVESESIWLIEEVGSVLRPDASAVTTPLRFDKNGRAQMQSNPPKVFISYNRADRNWAEWIAAAIERAGYQPIIQAWDFRPGQSFVQRMQKATAEADLTIAVLWEAYFKAEFTQPEWAAPFAQDPTGEKRKLIPVRIDACSPTGLLSQIIYIDLVGLGEQEAERALVDGLKPSGKPPQPPAFPGQAGNSSAPFPQPRDLLLLWRRQYQQLRLSRIDFGNWSQACESAAFRNFPTRSCTLSNRATIFLATRPDNGRYRLGYIYRCGAKQSG
jgi:hypothetical protein